MTDEELMVRYQNGDLKSFKILYERHAGRVYGFIRSRIRNVETSNDIHQAVFIKLHEARSKYDANLPFMPWLFTICRNAITDIMRTRTREAKGAEELRHASETSVQLEVSNLEKMPIADLPENQRLAVELRYLGNLSFDEIATRLGTTSINSRKLVSRAVTSLRKSLKGAE